MIPKIVERFPKYRNRVLTALSHDRVMAELCEDYDAVMSDLEIVELRSSGSGEQTTKTYRELARLKRELEHEVLARLATFPEEDGNG
ncbi:MAG: hypothetical protein U9Q81_22730 [Pseudomonadota bacterium]|nr:hypothetical protein [Pseudomonadota bacterium]